MTKKSERALKGRAAKVADQTDKQPGPVKPMARRREREPVDEGKQEGLERATRRRKAAHDPSNTISTEVGVLAADDELLHSPDSALSDAKDLLDEGLGQKAEQFMDAVVKVFCVHSDPNFSLPWQRKRQYSSYSSGFIISGRRILTNAHSVAHHTQVKVRRRGSEAKFIAKVLAQGPECDIALLTVEDESFWDSKINPVQFGQLPQLQDAVAVVGFPIGGDTMSVTSGVVSRIEVTSYSHGATALLGMQIDAAINAGNSGGPAFNAKGECVGIAFQSLKTEDAENIGYVIPVDVVHHFITDFERNNRFTSFPILGVDWQKMESPYLRAALGMKTEQKGVLIKAIEPTSNAASHLKKGDILLSFDGTVIANDGTVPFRSGERIGFSYLVSRKFTGDKGGVEVLRAGKVRQLELTLSTHNRLIPEHLSNRPPTYYIIAGFVFTQVSTPYLKSEYGKEYEWEAPVKLLDQLLHGKSQRPDQQVVVLGHVLAADCTVGYEELQNCEVNKVNGRAVNNLRELVEVVDACKQQYLKFELQYDVTVIIDAAIARAATKDIMAMHNISDDRSIDLRALQ